MKALRGLCILAALALAVAPLAAQDDRGGDSGAREFLDTIRTDLVELRFEKALAGIEAFLGKRGMTAADRVEALILRAQAHVAFGDLEGAERDYREILALRPRYRPDPSLTPSKAMVRFDKVRAGMIGTLRIVVDPADARVTVDGEAAVADRSGDIALLVGVHNVRAEAPGFDPLERNVAVDSGVAGEIQLQLMPNARTVVLETEPDDVEVLLDGVSVGRTERASGARRGAGVLTLENVALGDHSFELRKPCYQTLRFAEILTVNLLDRSALLLDPVRLSPARSTLMVKGGPAGAEVFVDGDSVGQVPIEAYAVCPGERKVTVRYAGRTLWSTVATLAPSTELALAVVVRPNVVVFGEVDWPAALHDFGATFNTRFEERLPRGLDPASAADWGRVRLAEGTDLAIAIVPAERVGERDRWFGYSPILRVSAPLEGVPARNAAPTWDGAVWGLAAADSRRIGPAIVVRVSPDGPAGKAGLAPGDRIARADGRGIESTAELRRVLASAAAEGRAVEVEWVREGQPGKARISSRRSPVVRLEAGPTSDDLLRAAWAVAQSTAAGDRTPEALANLALLFSRYGHTELAASTWRRVSWADRRGIGQGTKAYFLGRELARMGREDDAIEQYRLAAASAATAFDDEGPAIAPAAVDRLADFGIKFGPLESGPTAR